MNRRNIRAYCVLLSLIVMGLFLSGCDLEQVAETSGKVSTTAGKLSVVLPPHFQPIMMAIAAMAGAVPPVALAIAKFKEAKKLKKAIIAKSDQIDKVIIASKGNPDPGKQPVLDFLKADMRLADGERKSSLNYFDKIRKE